MTPTLAWAVVIGAVVGWIAGSICIAINKSIFDDD